MTVDTELLKLEPRSRERGYDQFGRLGSGAFQFMRTQPLGFLGLIVIASLLMLAFFPSLIAPQSYDDFNVRQRLEDPSADHWFGTDQQGRDVFSRVIYGARTTVLVGFGTVAIALALALCLGVLTGYIGGKLDIGVQRVVDIWMAFPGIIFLVYVIALVGRSTGSLILIMGLLFVPGASRLIRSAVLGVKSQPYIQAAESTGASPLRMMSLHVVPNVLPIAIISASVMIGGVILAEASLSFLGYGIPPPYPSWGRMLQEGRPVMYEHPHMSIFPGAAIAVVVFSFNVLGDALRDMLDPRLRGARG